MAEIFIGDRAVGDGHPTYVIAEIGVNHNGLLDLAIELVDAAVAAGADAVKFQKRSLQNLYPEKYLENPNVGEKSVGYMIPILQRIELSDDDYHEIVDYCKKKNITFFATPFDNQSADFIDSLGVPAYKIASADLLNWPLLEHLSKKGKPLILSTGMSNMHELEATVEYLKELQIPFALLHCNSTYPAPFESINLRFMNKLREFGVPVGYSGHERGIAVSTVAASMGASIIERHLTLDRTMDGPDHAASLEPTGFKKMVRDIRQVQIALGTGEEKFVSMGEIGNREVLAKSLVAAKRVEIGEEITRDKVTVKGPGIGLSPHLMKQLLGRKAERVVELDEPFLPVDLGEGTRREIAAHLPLQWGYVARYRDMHEILALEPKCLEFHFTDHDLDDKFPGGEYSQQLIVHAPEFWERTLVDLCSEHEAQRRDSVKLIQKSINIARELAPHFQGKPKIVVHPGAMHIDRQINNKRMLADNLLRSVEELDHSDVEMMIENLPPRPWYFGGQWTTSYFMDADDIVEYCKATGLTICFDICHHKLYCNWAHVSQADQVEKLLPYISHLHMSDAAGIDGEGLQVGEGNVDFITFFKQIKGFEGTMVPEIWRGHQNGGAGFVLAIERMAEAYDKAMQS
jgi:sialic acid synthase SpsE/sugar phosphate isomerase/epimerase